MTRLSPAPGPHRGGFTMGDFLILLGIVAVAAVVAYPHWVKAREQATAQEAREDVATIRAAVLDHRVTLGQWPSAAEPGSVPSDLKDRLPNDISFSHEKYALEWMLWELVRDRPQAALLDPETDTLPPPQPTLLHLGLLRVKSNHESVLATLLEEYGPASSFVRDSVWTLVLTPPS